MVSMWGQKHYASIAFFWRGEKKTLPESRQTFEIAAGQTPGLVNPVFSCQTGFFECEHPFTDKPMVITEPTVASTWLLRLVRNCFLGTCRARSTKISSHSRLSGVHQHKRQQRKALVARWRKSYSVYCENSLSLPVLNWVVVDWPTANSIRQTDVDTLMIRTQSRVRVRVWVRVIYLNQTGICHQILGGVGVRVMHSRSDAPSSNPTHSILNCFFP